MRYPNGERWTKERLKREWTEATQQGIDAIGVLAEAALEHMATMEEAFKQLRRANDDHAKAMSDALDQFQLDIGEARKKGRK